MIVRFRVNLGSRDAVDIQKATGASLNWHECVIGSEHDIADAAAKILLDKRIVERGKVRGEAKRPDLTAPAK